MGLPQAKIPMIATLTRMTPSRLLSQDLGCVTPGGGSMRILPVRILRAAHLSAASPPSPTSMRACVQDGWRIADTGPIFLV